MKRFVLGVLVVLGVSSAPSASAAPSTATPAANLKGYVCQTAKMPAQRAMSITAVMEHVDGTAKLQMRFQLIKRIKKHGPSATVSGPGLNTWLTPPRPKAPAATLGTQPGDKWVVKKPVVGLAAPAYYRFNIAFRWLDTKGQVISSAYRHSRVCFQPQLQPDLILKSAGESSKQPGSYWAKIKNTGPSPSSQYTVEVTPTDSNQRLAWSNLLAPVPPGSGIKTIWLTGQDCSSGEINVTLIPKVMTDDASAADNMLTVPCSTTGATPARAHRAR